MKLIRSLAYLFFVFIFVFHLIFFIVSVSYIFYLKNHNPSTTPLMELRKRQYNIFWVKHSFVKLSEVPKSFVRMLLIAEDCNFYRHSGIDTEGIRLALQKNVRKGVYYYGGSTISQQTARTLFLTPEKSFIRKYLELILTFEMEFILGKDRILELYLNYAEWGKGIFGVQAASKYFFGKDVRKLTEDEAMSLIAILPNPRKYTPFSDSKLVQSRIELIKSYYYQQ